MTEIRKCPRCGSEMKEADKIVGYTQPMRIFNKGDSWMGAKVVPFYCQSCGYIELYNEKNMKK